MFQCNSNVDDKSIHFWKVGCLENYFMFLYITLKIMLRKVSSDVFLIFLNVPKVTKIENIFGKIGIFSQILA